MDRIKEIETKDNGILICKFINGIEKEYDIKPLIKKYTTFKKLNNKYFFNKARVDCGGYGVSWNEEIDIATEEIWKNGKTLNGYITPDILKVEAIDNYTLKILFKTKEEKIYNMKKLIEEKPYYRKLKNKEYFKKVKPRGETIEWEEGEDICPEELYYNSKPLN